MNLLKKIAAFLVALFIASPAVYAQTSSEVIPRVFTLQEAIDHALQKGQSMKWLRLSLKSAQYNLSARKGALKPNAQLNLDLPRLNEQLLAVETANDLPAYTTRGSLRFAGTLSINQPLPTNGLFTISSTLFQDDVSTFRQSTATELKRR
jgi:hypothetical protein